MLGRNRMNPNPDPWKHRSTNLRCRTCMWFVIKERTEDDANMPPPSLGRCRKRAPTEKGFAPVFSDDWCGDHRLDENKI